MLDARALSEAVKRAGGPAEMARLAGLNRTTVERLLDGRIADPRVDAIVRIARAAGLTVDALVGDSTEPTEEREYKSIVDALHQAGLSQAEAARLASIPKSSLSMALRHKRRLTGEQDAALTRLLAEHGVTLALRARGRATWRERQANRRERLETAMRQPLSIEVREFFGLGSEPFVAVDFSSAALLKTKDYRLAYENLLAACEQRDFVVLCGPVGVGKTHILQAVLEELRRRERFVFCRVQHTETSCLSTYTLCHTILADFGIDTIPSQGEARARLVGRTLLANDKVERSAIVVVDEAHDLGVPLLRQLKRFHELVSHETGRPVLGIVLCGQLPLEAKLRRNPHLREVTWRASCISLEGLKGEVRKYLEHKLRRAGGSIQAWEQAATDELERRTIIPLAVNVVAARAMTIAWSHRELRGGRPIVKADDVRHAADEVL